MRFDDQDPRKSIEVNSMIPIAKPMIGPEEKRAVLEVLDSGMLAQGSRVEAFEEGFAEKSGTRFAVACSSGTTALQLALLAHGIGEGHEVITTPFTFIASANSILYTGARPVFVDIDPDTFTIDPEQIERAITPATRAIMPVHLFGLCSNMDAIQSIASQHGLVVIEDACQSHAAEYKGQKAGSFGTGAFSFYATKNMTTGEGGMITTNDEAIADRCRILRQHGMRVRYYHDELGYNFRMTDIQAAIGLAQLKKLEQFNATRIRNAFFLDKNLRGVTLPCVQDGYKHVYHQYTIRITNKRRDALVAHLHDKGIGTGVFYPVPVHQQSFYRKELGYAVSLPQAEKAASEVLSLPVHPGLSDSDLHAIVQAVNEFTRTL
jgi:perosamine synthetase